MLRVENYFEILQVLIMLIGDPAYKFIHVEDFGYVSSYTPRTSFGDFQTMLSVSNLLGRNGICKAATVAGN